tara:strand:+ start:265 stop:621 length:357 start_codon:yes stop_codon:yes gene_type:complete
MTKEELEIASEHYAHNHFEMHETNSYKELKRGFEAGAKYINQVVIEELEDASTVNPRELVGKFKEYADDSSYGYDQESAKNCALICVDEMIKNIIWSSDFNNTKRKELEEVKQEIEKL